MRCVSDEECFFRQREKTPSYVSGGSINFFDEQYQKQLLYRVHVLVSLACYARVRSHVDSTTSPRFRTIVALLFSLKRQYQFKHFLTVPRHNLISILKTTWRTYCRPLRLSSRRLSSGCPPCPNRSIKRSSRRCPLITKGLSSSRFQTPPRRRNAPPKRPTSGLTGWPYLRQGVLSSPWSSKAEHMFLDRCVSLFMPRDAEVA